METSATPELLLLDVDSLEFNKNHPCLNYPVDGERKESLQEQLKLHSPADAIKVWKSVRNGKTAYQVLDHYELAQVAFLGFVKKLWCLVINDVTDDDEAFFLLYRLSATSDNWTLLDRGLHLHSWVAQKDDIGGAFAEYARRAGCTRANITHANQAASVALYAKTHGMSSEFSSFRHRGTHLRHIYRCNQKHWIFLCRTMVEQDWSVRRVEEEVKRIIKGDEKPESAESAETEKPASGYVPEPEPEVPPLSYLDMLSELHDAIEQLQMRLMQTAGSLQDDFGALSVPDQDSVKEMTEEIHGALSSLLRYFPLSWIIASNQETAGTTGTDNPEATGPHQVDLI